MDIDAWIRRFWRCVAAQDKSESEGLFIKAFPKKGPLQNTSTFCSGPVHVSGWKCGKTIKESEKRA